MKYLECNRFCSYAVNYYNYHTYSLEPDHFLKFETCLYMKLFVLHRVPFPV